MHVFILLIYSHLPLYSGHRFSGGVAGDEAAPDEASSREGGVRQPWGAP